MGSIPITRSDFYGFRLWWRKIRTPVPTGESVEETGLFVGSTTAQVILDPFMDNGTTAVVAKLLDREWIGMEKNPEYAAIAEKRISQYPATGRRAAGG